MAELITVEMADRRRWRAWLERHHQSSAGVWLVFHKEHTRVRSISYEDSVREALCFGWIDSLIKRLDGDRYLRKSTPRKPSSKWSESNRKRWAELRAAGSLAALGLAAAPDGDLYASKPSIPELPGYIERAFQANPKAWAFFRDLAPSYRRHFVAWIHIARRQETREKRIRESIELLAAGKKLGLK
jgi:uncharacterized protein YdeI (YjbR/CyaY-like superfamily)